MGYFDEEKKQAISIASQYNKLMEMVQMNSNSSTAEMRNFIGKVEKQQGKLAELAKVSIERLHYVESVERNLEMLDNQLKKVPTLSEQEAISVFSGKKYGRLVDHSFNKSQPAKPQLLKAVQEAIDSEIKRGKAILSDQTKSVESWKKSASKHITACENAKKAVAGSDV